MQFVHMQQCIYYLKINVPEILTPNDWSPNFPGLNHFGNISGIKSILKELFKMWEC